MNKYINFSFYVHSHTFMFAVAVLRYVTTNAIYMKNNCHRRILRLATPLNAGYKMAVRKRKMCEKM